MSEKTVTKMVFIEIKPKDWNYLEKLRVDKQEEGLNFKKDFYGKLLENAVELHKKGKININ